MKRLIVVMLLMISIVLLNAQNKIHPINLSIWNPVALASYDSLCTTNYNLGLYSKTYRLNGIGLNILAHKNQENINGFTLSGVGEYVNGNMKGVQISGLFNMVKGYMHGIQIATIQNTNVVHTKGVMIAGITNFSIGNARGVQLAGAANMAGSNFSGLQASLGVNIASSSSNLFQISALTNVCAGRLHGVQIGAGNYAAGVKGFQLGLLNFSTGEVRGLQMGIINYSEDTSAVKLGLVNISPRTRIQLMAYGSNIVQNNLAVRFRNGYSYTIIGIGTNYKTFDNKTSGAIIYRFGLGVNIFKVFYISADAGYNHIENLNDGNKTDFPKRLYSLQARCNLEFHPFHRFGIFASGGYSHTRHYDSKETFENKPILEFGIILF